MATIHGTEEDRVNCPFYFKTGTCRHGDRCSRLHHKPAFSQTLLIPHFYDTNPQNSATYNTNQQQSTTSPQEHLWEFFEDAFMELSKYGTVVELHVIDNVSDHMVGNVYVKYRDEEEAATAQQALQGRYYDGRLLNQVEFCPVLDFREARCREFDEEVCKRGGFCNFLHIKPIPMPLIRSLEEDCEEQRRQQARDRKRHHRHDEDEEDEDRRRAKKKRKEHKSSSKKRSKKHHNRSSSKEREEDSSSSSDSDDQKGD